MCCKPSAPPSSGSLRRSKKRMFSGTTSDATNNNVSENLNKPMIPQGPSRHRAWLVTAWAVHFLITIAVLLRRIHQKSVERKYIPIDVNRVEGECTRAFVDVMADSNEASGAFICCGSSQQIQSELCNSPPACLVFARRLAKFPEAWLLPLFPLLIRGAFNVVQMILSWYHMRQQQHPQCGPNGSGNDRTVLRRLMLYLTLIQGRFWILYVVMDRLEEVFVEAGGDKDCWYQSMLPAGHDTCHGRRTDFSDHIVLYFAQILPLALTEVLQSFCVPYWESSSSSELKGEKRTSNRLVPCLLLIGLGYLYFITLLGADRTLAYFHTGPEVLTGYAISLLVQVPLSLLQCTLILPRWREYIFGRSDCQ